MPQQLAVAVENNFTKGFVTESTGLNFPENAATDTDNCEYTLIGDVMRRLGVDYEEGHIITSVDRTGSAVNQYKWNNVGGDGSTQVVVVQIGSTLYFFRSSTATVSSPLSARFITSVSILSFIATGGSFDITKCCEFTDGNGYLFVFHPSCDPVYISYTAPSALTASVISISIRDFAGIFDGLADNLRPSTAVGNNNLPHYYNILNQGWSSANPWSAASSSSVLAGTGGKVFTVAAGITGIAGGQTIVCNGYAILFGGQRLVVTTLSGTVTSYVGTTLTVNITSMSGTVNTYTDWEIVPISISYITTFVGGIGQYPSNSDQWWRFKNTSGVFDPVTTIGNVTSGTGPAPKGHFLLKAFIQDRATPSTFTSLTTISTTARPTNGTWFQGRVWYTGVNAAFPATGTASFTTWTENIYFSQVVNKPEDFGKCYQINDPTSEDLFDILPTDGGVMVIQGSGPIYKLFPTMNGLLVFAANGVWFITGSQGIGFSAIDYTITKISSIPSISSTSYVDVVGLPYFWNEDGIYQVQSQQNGSLAVVPITVGTIETFYDEIPLSSKRNARGAYHPIEYVIQWIYKDTEATSVSDSFSYNKILNFNTYNKAFFPYTVDNSADSINGICYVTGPGGLNTTDPAFKYFTTSNLLNGSFSDIHDTDYVDWGGINYSSYFITGYKLRGQAIKRFQPQYIQLWSRLSDTAGSYQIQGIWDYAASGNSGRYSSPNTVETPTNAQFLSFYRRHKIRGHGYALQFKVMSVNSKPFDIIGWAVVDTVNAGT